LRAGYLRSTQTDFEGLQQVAIEPAAMVSDASSEKGTMESLRCDATTDQRFKFLLREKLWRFIDQRLVTYLVESKIDGFHTTSPGLV
jgi:hypothetical protein